MDNMTDTPTAKFGQRASNGVSAYRWLNTKARPVSALNNLVWRAT